MKHKLNRKEDWMHLQCSEKKSDEREESKSEDSSINCERGSWMETIQTEIVLETYGD